MRRFGRLLVLVGAMAVPLSGLAAVAVTAPTAAGAATPKALILNSTVSGGTSSLEAQQAVLDGFAVTGVTDTQWGAMTAAQFKAYQVLIIGDPFCGTTVGTGTAAQTNDGVWEPVVMASKGNRVVIGTDPTDHHSGHPGATTLEKNGIAFAGAKAGATGLYLDLSCTYDSSPAHTPVPILDGLSTHGAHSFTVVGNSTVNGCATGVNIVAQTGPTAGLTDANLSNWSCSVHEAFETFPSDWTPLALAPSSSGFPSSYCANDVGTHTLACGSPYIMIAGAGVTISSDISLTPAKSTLPVGGSVTLTATVKKAGTPEGGKAVSFRVESGPNVGKIGSGVTNAAGQTTFSYSDTGGAGEDTVTATFKNDSGQVEQSSALVDWGGVLGNGLMMLGGDGGMFAFGAHRFVGPANFGGTPGPLTTPLGQVIPTPFTALAETPDHNGFFDVLGNGQLFPVGSAKSYGDLAGKTLAAPISGIAATHDGKGYWMVGKDGGLFSFGDAAFHGSLPSQHITPAAPIVGIAATPDGGGYWMVGRDGGIFGFGDAGYYRSLPANHITPAAPITGMTPSLDGRGYLLVGGDGGVFNFGDASFHGSSAGTRLAAPIVAIALTISGNGYWLVGGDGGVFTHGDAPFQGSLPGQGVHLRAPIVGAIN